MTDPTLATLKAVRAALLVALPCPVHGRVPPGAALPYVVIDQVLAQPDDPLASRWDVVRIYLTVWSAYEGQKEVLELLAMITAALHRRDLSLDTGQLIGAAVERRGTDTDLDQKTEIGRATIRCLVRHTP